MEKFYTDEKQAQILIYLLKAHGIKRVVVSPGSTNVDFVTSIQNDSFFVLYSSVDERSAAYIACGLAAESQEPVVLSCTGATASRNYLPGLTEAYYRKLPLIAITSTQHLSKVGHRVPQVIDRSIMPKDTCKVSVTLPIVNDETDRWDCEIKINKAIHETTRAGGGPVHINIPTTYTRTFNTKELPKARLIKRYNCEDTLPLLPDGQIAVFIGSHLKMTDQFTKTLDAFCIENDAVVFYDHTSNYNGKYGVLFSLIGGQKYINKSSIKPDLVIYIGEISGDYYSAGFGDKLWRINPDGDLSDTYQKMSCIFEMTEEYFFMHYSKNGLNKKKTSSYEEYNRMLKNLQEKIPVLPFSNIYIALELASKLPKHSVVHFGILSSLRSWNFFEIDNSINLYSNVGGFGIDGGVSSLVGASLYDRSKIYFGIVGDLAFFYDMNAIGNRDIQNNIRLMVINNGKGVEFRLGIHPTMQYDKAADDYIAAAGHFGNKSTSLIKNYAESLDFEYLSARNKEEFEKVYHRFVNEELTERPILFEVFTDSDDENEALELITSIEVDKAVKIKKVAKDILGEKTITRLGKFIK